MVGPPRSVVPIAHSTWAVVAFTFVALLGGTHPSDHGRDATLLVVVVVDAPLAVGWHGVISPCGWCSPDQHARLPLTLRR